MAAGDERNGEKSKKGFSGLSSMVSDVDTTVADVQKANRVAADTATGDDNPSPRPQTVKAPQSRPEPYQQHTSQPSPSGGSSAGKWLLGIAAVVGYIWLLSESGNKNTPPSTSYTPSTSPPVTSSSPIGQPAPGSFQPQTASRPSEEKPPVGTGHVLGVPQVRYCVAEDIRLDAAKGVVNKQVEADIDRFNAMVADYNSRCGEFRYRRGALESARSDIEAVRSLLYAEGRSRFLTGRASRSAQPQAESDGLQRDPTVLALQRRLNELGYDAGTADGLMGGKTRSAILAFQRDVGLVVDGKVTSALLQQLESSGKRRKQEAKSIQTSPPSAGGAIPLNQAVRTPSSSIATRCRFSSECTGSMQCLDGVCRPSRSAQERCSASFECAGAMQCLDGVCRPSRSAQERCSASFECAGAMQCLDGSCRPSRAAGERCSASFECAGSMQCLDGTCRSSRAAGTR